MTTALTSPPPSAPTATAATTTSGASRRRRRRGKRTAGIGGGPLPGSTNRLAPFGPAILAVRWASAAVSVALATGAFLAGDLAVIAWVVVVLAATLVRTATPLVDDGTNRRLAGLLLDSALHLVAVVATGFWASPLVFSLPTAVIVAGFARGFGFALRLAVASSLAVALAAVAAGRPGAELVPAAQWSTILVLVAIVAGCARRINGEADHQHNLTMDRLSRLADANALLSSLHGVAQTLPASLDTDEVLESTIRRLRGLLVHHGAAILLFDDTDATWTVGRRSGMVGTHPRLAADELPVPARVAVRTKVVQVVDDLTIDGPGFAPGHRAGLYAPLTARGRLVGLLAVEHRDPRSFGSREREIVQGFIEPVSLALDNARWFARLRTVSANEERTRIARDLHDRIGQSLAYLAFELDRIVKRDEEGDPVSAELTQLRSDLRGVIGEVRDTLQDLRTDVTEDKDFAAVLTEFAARLADRTGLQISCDAADQERLSPVQEREMWRITQEALTNVERHAAAGRVAVTWRCNGVAAGVEIVDDGRGFPVERAGRLDSYGILGMKERASSIGASLEIESAPGEGTTVRCYLEPR